MLLPYYGNVGHFMLCKYKTSTLQEWGIWYFPAKENIYLFL